MRNRHWAGAVFALLIGATGCARGPDIAVNGLALQRVVIYRNGVGYFERRGRISDEEVTFQVRTERVGDFLATLAVIEQGGSSVQSASFPIDLEKKKPVDDDDDEEEGDGDKRLPLKHKKKHKEPDERDSLETVKLTLDGKEHDLTIGYVAETPVWRPSYRLVVHSHEGPRGDKPAENGADLQAWGIVQNSSGEDWKGVHLSLVAGAPLAFQSTLEKAVIPQRPIVTDTGEVISSVPTGETSLASAPPEPPPPPPAPPMTVQHAGPSGSSSLAQLAERDADRPKAVPNKKTAAVRRYKPDDARAAGVGAASRAMAPAAVAVEDARMAAPPIVRGENPSPPRSLRSLASVAVEGSTTRYDLPFTVDVPNHSATMVLLAAKPVPGESIFLWAPDGGVPGSNEHPFRVARFTNDTKGLLERGPIAVFENGAFLGQGMVDPLPPGATATVPFALERSFAIDRATTQNEEGSRLALIEAGRIEIERDWVTHTKYTVKNGGELDGRTLIKHVRLYNSRLHGAPKGTEDNTGTGSALIPIDVGKRATAVLDVDERRIDRRAVDPLDPLADDAVRGYLADARADQAVVSVLRPAWEARAKLRQSVDERDKLENERIQLESQIDQVDRSLRAIEKNKLADQLRRDLTDRLAKAHTRLDEVTKRRIVVDMQVSEQAIRFRDLLASIKMLKALPAPT